MFHYRLTPDEVLKLPVGIFWMMTAKINRLRAELDLRQLRILAAAQSQDGMKEVSNALISEMGDPVKRAVVYRFERKKLQALAKSLKSSRGAIVQD